MCRALPEFVDDSAQYLQVSTEIRPRGLKNSPLRVIKVLHSILLYQCEGYICELVEEPRVEIGSYKKNRETTQTH